MNSENKGYALAVENGQRQEKREKNISQTDGALYSAARGGGGK